MNTCHVSILSRWAVAAALLGSLLLPGALPAQTVTAAIPVTAADVAVNPVSNTIYALSNGTTVAVIDGATNSVVATITLASGTADTSAINPMTNSLYVGLEGYRS